MPLVELATITICTPLLADFGDVFVQLQQKILTLYCIIDWAPPYSMKWAGAQSNKTPQSPGLGFVQCLQIDLFLAVFLQFSYETFLMNRSSFDKDRQHSS